MHRAPKIVIVGASGVFGRRIAQNVVRLLGRADEVVLVARSSSSVDSLKNDFPHCTVLRDDVHSAESALFAQRDWRPRVVVNACGPYEGNSVSNFACAVRAAQHDAHYVDLADNDAHVQRFAAHLQTAVPHSKSILVTGASTVPAIALAALEDSRTQFVQRAHFGAKMAVVDVAISAGIAQSFGAATVDTVRSMVRAKFTRLDGRAANEPLVVRGWRRLRRIKFAGLAQSRLVGEVPTPDLNLIPKFFPSVNFVRVSAGVDSALAMRFMQMLSWLPERLVPSSQWLSKVLNSRSLTRLLGTDVGAMKVAVVSHPVSMKDPPLFYEWTLIGEKGDGPQTPCSVATILAERLFSASDAQLPPPGCYVGGDPELRVGVDELERYWNKMGFHLHIKRTLRPFRSPIHEALTQKQFDAMGETVFRNAHCFGGYFEGNMQVLGSRFFPVCLLMRAFGFLWPTRDAAVPVRVWIQPTTDETLIFHRLFNGKLLRSEMRAYENSALIEIFSPWQLIAQEIRGSNDGSFQLLGRRFWPLPEHVFPLKVHAKATPRADMETFDLHVEASMPFIGTVFGYKGTLRAVYNKV